VTARAAQKSIMIFLSDEIVLLYIIELVSNLVDLINIDDVM